MIINKSSCLIVVRWFVRSRMTGWIVWGIVTRGCVLISLVARESLLNRLVMRIIVFINVLNRNITGSHMTWGSGLIIKRSTFMTDIRCLFLETVPWVRIICYTTRRGQFTLRRSRGKPNRKLFKFRKIKTHWRRRRCLLHPYVRLSNGRMDSSCKVIVHLIDKWCYS